MPAFGAGRVVGYTADADSWCPYHAVARYGWFCEHDRTSDVWATPGIATIGVRMCNADPMLDEHGVPLNALDREGNGVHPVFASDEAEFGLTCGDAQCTYIILASTTCDCGDGCPRHDCPSCEEQEIPPMSDGECACVDCMAAVAEYADGQDGYSITQAFREPQGSTPSRDGRPDANPNRTCAWCGLTDLTYATGLCAPCALASLRGDVCAECHRAGNACAHGFEPMALGA